VDQVEGETDVSYDASTRKESRKDSMDELIDEPSRDPTVSSRIKARRNSSGALLPADSDFGKIPQEMVDEEDDTLSSMENMRVNLDDDEKKEETPPPEKKDPLREKWRHSEIYYDLLRTEFEKMSASKVSLELEELKEFMMVGYPKLRTSRKRDQKIADFMGRYGHDGVMRWEDLVNVYSKDNERKLQKEFITRGYSKELGLEPDEPPAPKAPVEPEKPKEVVREPEPREPEPVAPQNPEDLISREDINRLLQREFKKFSSNRKSLNKRELASFFIAGYPELKKDAQQRNKMVSVFLRKFGDNSTISWSGLLQAYNHCKMPDLVKEFKKRGYETHLQRLIKRKQASATETAAPAPAATLASSSRKSSASGPSTRKASRGSSRSTTPSTSSARTRTRRRQYNTGI